MEEPYKVIPSDTKTLSYYARKMGSDGCTAAPDLNVRSCCEEHDYHYRTGDISRVQADKLLRKCMQQKGWLVMPWVYWVLVRTVGSFFYKKGLKDVDVA